jgi:methylmalonyl-CoA mutase
LVGTNQFPNFNEMAADKLEKCSTCHVNAAQRREDMATLNTERLADEFEALRLADREIGSRPKAFMLTIGNLGYAPGSCPVLLQLLGLRRL